LCKKYLLKDELKLIQVASSTDAVHEFQQDPFHRGRGDKCTFIFPSIIFDEDELD